MDYMDTVYGFAGHSIVPTLALIHSNIADRYVFMFTEELKENKLMFERYLKQKKWEGNEPKIVLHSIGSVGNFSETFQQIKEIIDQNQKYALFLQNGAKQLLMAMILQNPDAPRIFLQEPLTLQIYSSLVLQHQESIEFSPEEVISARGVSLEDPLLENITLKFDSRGRIEFTKRVGEVTESDVSSIVQLIGKFGRNGAVYRLVYNFATRRIWNTIPGNVVSIKEELQ